ncbi:MAG: hypothetical protein M0R32_08460 [Candidatus Cloacimonetes bacterium]|jgi:hypothetical protein|nr:hypothetical protein [Candidatus Cloacimonadota bacterium]
MKITRIGRGSAEDLRRDMVNLLEAFKESYYSSPFDAIARLTDTVQMQFPMFNSYIMGANPSIYETMKIACQEFKRMLVLSEINESKFMDMVLSDLDDMAEEDQTLQEDIWPHRDIPARERWDDGVTWDQISKQMPEALSKIMNLKQDEGDDSGKDFIAEIIDAYNEGRITEDQMKTRLKEFSIS